MAKNRGKLIQLPRESIHSSGEGREDGLTIDHVQLGEREFIKHIKLLLLGYKSGRFPTGGHRSAVNDGNCCLREAISQGINGRVVPTCFSLIMSEFLNWGLSSYAVSQSLTFPRNSQSTLSSLIATCKRKCPDWHRLLGLHALHCEDSCNTPMW